MHAWHIIALLTYSLLSMNMFRCHTLFMVKQQLSGKGHFFYPFSHFFLFSLKLEIFSLYQKKIRIWINDWQIILRLSSGRYHSRERGTLSNNSSTVQAYTWNPTVNIRIHKESSGNSSIEMKNLCKSYFHQWSVASWNRVAYTLIWMISWFFCW